MKRCGICGMEWNDYLTAALMIKQGGHADISCHGQNRNHIWVETTDEYNATGRYCDVERACGTWRRGDD